ncbi:MAG: hypothetical protein CMN76_18480 [Spirochaetaceae bacterium]|nr:hypothetical protein [Spirochaetaceae bacterium]|tara:strand:+ start:286301 stop:286795 length:495 start_codon:yes stop_codon:yes gene_type:complete
MTSISHGKRPSHPIALAQLFGMRFLCLVLPALPALVQCTPSGLSIDESFMPAPMHNKSAALYIHINNGTDELRVLTAVSSPIATSVEVHETVQEDGLMKMQRLSLLALPPRSITVMEPGGLHIMLKDLDRLPVSGDEIELTLHFQNRTTMTIRVPVVSPETVLE